MLLKFYTLQEIFDALNEIKKLKSLGYICENVSEFVVYDYTNLFNIDIVYFDIYTELVEKTVKKLVSDGFNIHLKENILKEQKQVVQQNVSNTDIEFLIEQLDIFLKNWSDKCNFQFFTIYLKIIDIVYQYENKLICQLKEHIQKYPYLYKYFCIVTKSEKNLFPCRAGLNTLYITEDGQLKICFKHLHQLKKISGKIANYRCSVYEKPMCNSCWSKFICGGYCEFNKEETEKGCIIFKSVVQILIKLTLS